MKRLVTLLSVLGLVVFCLPAFAASAPPAEEGEGLAILPDYEYIELRPLTVPVITDKGLVQQVSIVVLLELPYGKMAEVEPYAPKLADAFLRDLYGTLGAGGAMRDGTVDAAAVKHRLDTITAEILGKDMVHDILLQVIRQKPL